MKAGLAQINTIPGDFDGNREKIAAAYHVLVAEGVDVVITPELALTGLTPDDLLFRPRFADLAEAALAALAAEVGSVPLLVGHVIANPGPGRPFYNAAILLHEGNAVAHVEKSLPAAPDLLDESRTFEPPVSPSPLLELGGETVSIVIGDEIYDESLVASLKAGGATVLLHLGSATLIARDWKRPARRVEEIAEDHGLAVASCQPVGGQVTRIYPGGSVAASAAGHFTLALPLFEEAHGFADLCGPAVELPDLEPIQAIHDGLVMALHDYVRKSGFHSVVLGLSGGIDSAVVAALAVEALGSEKVHGVSMPTEYSSEGSVNDALELAKNLGIDCPVLPIQGPLEAFRLLMAESFKGLESGVTEENMQPRLRGMVVMSLSNKFHHLALSTGNKSEIAMGYCTLYGDMVGGFSPICDLYKTEVYELARYLNREREVIPVSTIEKPPSAELKPGQVDQDTLPPYEELDEILALIIEEELTACDLAARGFEEELVNDISRRLEFNEYKRTQAAPGPQLSRRGFGPGRRVPLIHRFSDPAA